mgnify:CR=1 FL=1
MKKLSLIALFAALVALNGNATDLFSGSQHVSWDDGGLQIAAEQFADAAAGQKLVVHFTDATDGIEFKVMNANFDHLAGSREAAWISGNGTFEQFLTATAVDSLQAHGLEIIGANFTCTQVELLEGKAPKEGYTVWTGFFWADAWTTLELYYNGYEGVDWEKTQALRIYSEAGRSDFIVKIMSSWDPEGLIADQDAMTAGEGYLELELTDDLRTALAEAGRWMIQFNKEEGDPFNVTDIVIVMADEEEQEQGQDAVVYYIKNNWGGGADWTWQEMTPSNDNEWMYEGVFGGTGVNINTAESDDDATWYPLGDPYKGHALEGDAIEAGQKVRFVYNVAEATVTAINLEPAGLEHIKFNADIRKTIIDGQLVIVHEHTIFNAQGTRLH